MNFSFLDILTFIQTILTKVGEIFVAVDFMPKFVAFLGQLLNGSIGSVL